MNITPEDIQNLACEFELETDVIKALLDVHGCPTGFSKETDAIVIHFEPFHFERYTGMRLGNGVENQVTERKAYNKAFGLNPKVAMLSTQWGRMKVYGFLHIHAGYDTVNAMEEAFSESEYNQVRGCLKSIKYSNQAMFDALQQKEWATFASYFWGNYYKRMGYHTQLQDSYNKSIAFR